MTLAEKVYQKIRQGIFNGQFTPHTFFIEKEVAEQYGVSKGTAGEALHRLCLEGHLVSYPRKGYLLNILNVEEHKQIQRLRIAVESLVLEVLVEEAATEDLEVLYQYLEDEIGEEEPYTSRNTRFHMKLAKLTKDKHREEAVYDLIGSLTRTRIFFEESPKYEGQEFHRGMIDALIARDSGKAKEQLKEDLLRK